MATNLDRTQVDTFQCRTCGQIKPRSDFYTNTNSNTRRSKDCKHCYCISEHKRYRKHRLAYHQQYYKTFRLEVLNTYGGRCTRCGESDLDLLVIDHINNDGAKERKRFHASSFYRNIKAQGFPKDKYQILCLSCNWKKHLNNGILPPMKNVFTPQEIWDSAITSDQLVCSIF